MLRRLFRRGHRTRGQSMVEFALILPVFLLLFATVLDLGRIAAAQIAVNNAAREGAFQAASTPSSYVSGAACDQTTNLVTCRVQLEARGSVVSVAPADIAVVCSPSPCAKGIGNTVAVSVTGHFQLLTTVLSSFFGGTQNVAFTATSTNQIETLPAPLVPAGPTATPTATPTPTPTATATATATPTPTPTPACIPPSAGFSYTVSPSSNQHPVTLSVVDKSTPAGTGCITSWLWTWGDGYTSTGQVPNGAVAGQHTYANAAPNGPNGSYGVTLTVTGPGGTNTSGAVLIIVK